MTGSLDELWERVWSAPDDDRPAQILADALMERGDPYGEWLAVGLAGARGSRALRERAEACFLGALAEVVRRPGWRRGFLDRVTVQPASLEALDATRLHAGWRTVRRLEISARQDRRLVPVIRWLGGFDGWRWLETVALGPPTHLQALLRSPDLEIRHLEVGFLNPMDAGRIADPAVFPALRTFRLAEVPIHAPSARTELGALVRRPLDSVTGPLHPASIAVWAEIAEGAACTVVLEDDRWSLALERSGDLVATPLHPEATRSTVHGLVRRMPEGLRRTVSFTS